MTKTPRARFDQGYRDGWTDAGKKRAPRWDLAGKRHPSDHVYEAGYLAGYGYKIEGSSRATSDLAWEAWQARGMTSPRSIRLLKGTIKRKGKMTLRLAHETSYHPETAVGPSRAATYSPSRVTGYRLYISFPTYKQDVWFENKNDALYWLRRLHSDPGAIRELFYITDLPEDEIKKVPLP